MQKIKELASGTISITIPEIEEIAKRYFDKAKEIRSVKLSIVNTKTGIDITVRMTLAPQAAVPAITEKIQSGLKEHVENFAGIIIENVDVIVYESTTALR